MIKCVMLVDMLISFDHNQLSSAFKGKYFGQNPLFFPLPSTEIPLFLPCFLVKKVVKCRSMITVGAKRQKFCTFYSQNELHWTEMARKQGKTGQITQKQEGFLGISFSLAAEFFPVFWQGEFFPPPGGSLLAKIFTLVCFDITCNKLNNSIIPPPYIFWLTYSEVSQLSL